MSVWTVRPASNTAFFTTLVNVGGASLHASLADDLEANYGACYSFEGVKGNLFTWTDTGSGSAGDVPSRYVLRGRTACLNSGPVLTASYAGGSGGAAATTITWATPTTHALAEGPLLTWPDESVPGYVNIACHGNWAGYIYELYLDLYYVRLPIVVVQTPTEGSTTTTNNRPPVTWANNFDSEGGAQTYYEVKIFDDANYPASVAAAITSTAYDETSGITNSSAQSWTPTNPQVNDTYRAYVRTGQTVNGEIDWSVYDYNTYTVNVALPGVPTLSASASSANGRNDLQTADNAGAATTDFIQIQTSYDGEVTWHDVRTELGGGLLSAWASTPDLSDYEAPNGGLASYRARALHTYADFYGYSAWSASAFALWSSTSYWLKHPYDPTLNTAIRLVSPATSGASSERASGRVPAPRCSYPCFSQRRAHGRNRHPANPM